MIEGRRRITSIVMAFRASSASLDDMRKISSVLSTVRKASVKPSLAEEFANQNYTVYVESSRRSTKISKIPDQRNVQRYVAPMHTEQRHLSGILTKAVFYRRQKQK
jgi:predicted RNA-binding protein